MRKIIMIILILASGSIACSAISGLVRGDVKQNTTPTPPLETLPYPGFSLEGLGSYSATYEIRFEGSYTWTYFLRIRSNGSIREYRLQYEGVDPSDNPGDVRMVTDGETSRMLGPGTDNECFFFPSDFETDLSFFTPDDLINPYLVNEGISQVGEDEIVGFIADHFSAQSTDLGEWKNVRVDIWLSRPDRATLLYEMSAEGEDPLFDAGRGRVSANYLVKEMGEQIIDPITGCDPPVPVPESATHIVSYPGLVAFNSEDTPQKIVAFFQSALPAFGWVEAGPVEVVEDAVLMSFQRGDEQMQINIEIISGGVKVEILLQLL